MKHLVAINAILVCSTLLARTDADPIGSQPTDRDYDINIPHKQISEVNYSTAAELGVGQPTNKDVAVHVGCSVSASRATITFTNVQGHVHLKGSLDRLKAVTRRVH